MAEQTFHVSDLPSGTILSVRDLHKFYEQKRALFGSSGGEVRAVDGVSFDIQTGSALGLVGESGCGKSTISRMIARLVEPTSGQVLFEGEDITAMSRAGLRRLRRRMQMILQDPFSFLNPQLTAAGNVQEALRIQGVPRQEWDGRVEASLRQVGLKPGAGNRMPNELSGGERQRVGIARAIILNPSMLVLDEAVSALDVSVRAQVINLLKQLRAELNLTYLFISHDLAVVRTICSHVAVMYLGKVIEAGARDDIFDNPRHPYTQTLLSSVPLPNPQRKSRPRIPVLGEPPSALNPPQGCRFHTRCWKAQRICSQDAPTLDPVGSRISHTVACHFPGSMEEALIEAPKALAARLHSGGDRP